MVFSKFIAVIAVVVALYFIWKYARKAWRAAGIEDKIENAETLHDAADAAATIDLDQIKEDKKTLDSVDGV